MSPLFNLIADPAAMTAMDQVTKAFVLIDCCLQLVSQSRRFCNWMPPSCRVITYQLLGVLHEAIRIQHSCKQLNLQESCDKSDHTPVKLAD